MTTTEEQVLCVLRESIHPQSAMHLHKLLEHLHKSEINRALYALHKENEVCRVESTPPLWYVARSDVILGGNGNTMVYVDLGTVHDCLEHLMPYRDQGLVSVVAFADHGYSGYGKDLPCVRISEQPSKAFADVGMIWTIAEQCITQQGLSVYIVSKDKQFGGLVPCILETGNTVKVVSSWEELREFIE